MPQEEHSTILLTHLATIFALFIFEWPFYTGFTVLIWKVIVKSEQFCMKQNGKLLCLISTRKLADTSHEISSLICYFYEKNMDILSDSMFWWYCNP